MFLIDYMIDLIVVNIVMIQDFQYFEFDLISLEKKRKFFLITNIFFLSY